VSANTSLAILAVAIESSVLTKARFEVVVDEKNWRETAIATDGGL
jgi:hypothetical protein